MMYPNLPSKPQTPVKTKHYACFIGGACSGDYALFDSVFLSQLKVTYDSEPTLQSHNFVLPLMLSDNNYMTVFEQHQHRPMHPILHTAKV